MMYPSQGMKTYTPQWQGSDMWSWEESEEYRSVGSRVTWAPSSPQAAVQRDPVWQAALCLQCGIDWKHGSYE